MTAAILERGDLASLGAKEHDRLAQKHAAERLARDDILGEGGDIPGVAYKHERLSDQVVCAHIL